MSPTLKSVINSWLHFWAILIKIIQLDKLLHFQVWWAKPTFGVGTLLWLPFQLFYGLFHIHSLVRSIFRPKNSRKSLESKSHPEFPVAFQRKIMKNLAESPRYTLIELKKEPEARETLVKLRGTDNVSFHDFIT